MLSGKDRTANASLLDAETLLLIRDNSPIAYLLTKCLMEF